MGYLIHLVRGEAAVQRLLYHAKALYPAEFKRAAYAVKIAAERNYVHARLIGHVTRMARYIGAVGIAGLVHKEIGSVVESDHAALIRNGAQHIVRKVAHNGAKLPCIGMGGDEGL